MRKVLPVVLMLGLAACGTTMRWDKPGATDEMVTTDLTSCRQAARQEANRYYPGGYYPWGFGYGWGGYRSNWMLWQMRVDNDRFYAENRLFAFCMRTKGYEQVEVKPPPSPEPK